MCALLSSVIEEVKLGIGFCIICKNFEHGQLLHLSKSSGRSVSTNWQEQGSLCLHKNNFTLDCGWLCASRLPGLPLCQPLPTPPDFFKMSHPQNLDPSLILKRDHMSHLISSEVFDGACEGDVSIHPDWPVDQYVGERRLQQNLKMLIDADWYADRCWLVDQDVCERRLQQNLKIGEQLNNPRISPWLAGRGRQGKSREGRRGEGNSSWPSSSRRRRRWWQGSSSWRRISCSSTKTAQSGF